MQRIKACWVSFLDTNLRRQIHFWRTPKHAEERQQQWQQRLGITRAEVEALVNNPQQVVIEDDVAVAQSKRGQGLLRVPFADIGNT